MSRSSTLDEGTGRGVAPWWHTLLMMVPVVVLSVMGARRSHGGADGLAAHHARQYAATLVFEWLLFALAWWGLRIRRTALREVTGARPEGWRGWMETLGAAAVFWLAAMLVLTAVGLLLQHAHLASPQKTIAKLAPENAAELALWLALSLSAGIAEEFVFRGYMLRQFARVSCSFWAGVLVSSLLFGFAHGYEGLSGMLAITIFGALFCMLVRVRGSIFAGMMAHAWHDAFTGIALAILKHARML